MNPQQEPDYDQPVAYDRDGRPLYTHPPTAVVSQAPVQQVTSAPQFATSQTTTLSPELVQRHEDAAKKYPMLNLSKEEFIISEIRRHPIGLLGPLLVSAILILLVLLGLAAYPTIVPNNNPPFASIIAPALLLLVLIALGTYIVVWVYRNNKFFLTNESVIQEIQSSLFSHNEQTVSLGNIEDASFTQPGILAVVFNFGSIRLSTEGDETTYRFNYVSNPKQQIALLNNAVEAFKNHRPVDTDES